MSGKRYSWLSYASIGLGTLLIFHPLLTKIFPKYFMGLQYTGISLTLLFSVLAFKKKNEKKSLAVIGLSLAMIMLVFVGVLLYIPFHKDSTV
jgi:tryptophan-rich sensory protein